jgi:hypothetical protein
MTKQEFLTRFYLEADKISTLSGPGYKPTELEKFATIAQEALVLERYTPNNKYREGFEETEKRVQDLGELVTIKQITPATTSSLNLPNGVFCTLPNTQLADPTDFSDVFWLPILEYVITKSTDSCKNNKRVQIKDIKHLELEQLLQDPFNRPSIEWVFRLRVDNLRHELITDGTFEVKSYYVRYIRKPLPIDLQTNLTEQVSELSDHVHQELLEKTILMVYKSNDEQQKLVNQIQLETN